MLRRGLWEFVLPSLTQGVSEHRGRAALRTRSCVRTKGGSRYQETEHRIPGGTQSCAPTVRGAAFPATGSPLCADRTATELQISCTRARAPGCDYMGGARIRTAIIFARTPDLYLRFPLGRHRVRWRPRPISSPRQGSSAQLTDCGRACTGEASWDAFASPRRDKLREKLARHSLWLSAVGRGP